MFQSILDFFQPLLDSYKHPIIGGILKSIGILILGLMAIGLSSRVTTRLLRPRLSAQGLMVFRRLITSIGFFILAVFLLSQFGIDLKAILGAAGVAGIAIGLASQTSLSNIISGLFLIGERPFAVGDVIDVAGTVGTVESIGLLSLTMRTFQNHSVRIPNESIIKSQVTNITMHPIRRVDFEVGVSYSDDPELAIKALRTAALSVNRILRNPEPLILFTGYGASSVNFKIGIWCARNELVPTSNELVSAIHRTFKQEGIEIPYPHLTLAHGKAYHPLESTH